MADLKAADVVAAAIRDLEQHFVDTERAALAGEPDGVHQHRTVVRRLRSVLQVFRELLDPYAVKRLRGLLREWGSALGVVRDHEVAAQLADALLADVPSAGSDPRVAARLVQPELVSAAAAHQRLVHIHDLERMRELRRLLHEFATDPPLSPAADASAENIRALLIHDAEVVSRKARPSRRSLESQHTLRKRARRLRHAIDAALTDPPGMADDGMSSIAKAAHRIQSDLGDHRDATLLAERIERIGILAGRAGEEVSIYDELANQSRAYASDRLRSLRHAKKKLATAIDDAEAP